MYRAGLVELRVFHHGGIGPSGGPLECIVDRVARQRTFRPAGVEEVIVMRAARCRLRGCGRQGPGRHRRDD